MSPVRLSVLMPVRDGLPFVAEAIASVLAQDLTGFEFVIVDDRSSDGTAEVLQRCAAADARIRVLAGAGGGLVAALNLGLAACTAPLVARMDADDVALPGRFAAQVAAMESRPGLLVLGSQVERIDARGRRIGVSRHPHGAALAAGLQLANFVAHPSAMLRREAVLRLGGYRAWFRGCEDYDLWLRCARAGEIDNLDAVLLRHRIHPGSVSARQAREQAERLVVAQALAALGDAQPVPLADDPVEALLALPLPPDLHARLIRRMLAAAAPLAGDERDDPRQAQLAGRLQATGGWTPRERTTVRMRAAGRHARAGRVLAALRTWLRGLGEAPLATLAYTVGMRP